MTRESRYLGDGVYAQLVNDTLILTTGHHICSEAFLTSLSPPSLTTPSPLCSACELSFAKRRLRL